MSEPSPRLLDRAGIEDAFRHLGERLARRGVVADLYVFGGAAMAKAMKALAARPRDIEDIRRLVELLGLRDAGSVLACVREVFPEEEPPERLRLLLDDIFSAQEGSRPGLPRRRRQRRCRRRAGRGWFVPGPSAS